VLPAGSANFSSASSFPVLSGGKLVWTQAEANVQPIGAWNQLLGNYRLAPVGPPGLGDLRQAIGLARPEGRRPGQSRWPEADTLRRLCGVYSQYHDPTIPRTDEGIPCPLPDWFPRAAYGLPLQFKFKYERHAPAGNNDPAPNSEFNFNLLPVDGDRWPSPVTLKVVRLGNRIFKIGLLLNQRIPEIRCQYDNEALKELRTQQSNAGRDIAEGRGPGPIPADQHPDSFADKKLPKLFPIPGQRHPHDGLFDKLFLEKTVHTLSPTPPAVAPP
jgi:hypothetical protein